MTKYNEQTNEQISVQVEKYTQRISYTSAGLPEYLGLSLPGAATSVAVWQIRKLIYTRTNVTSILWANGNNNFTNKWTEILTISFS